jgi:LPXTG-motif cell wall-anchored protein
VLLLRVIGVFLVLIGGVWLVQGLGVVSTGSFMDGQSVWAVIGGACMAGGLVVLSRSRRRRT